MTRSERIRRTLRRGAPLLAALLWSASAFAGEAGSPATATATAPAPGEEPISQTWEVDLASDAQFDASSGEILTPEEQAKLQAAEVLRDEEEEDERALDRIRDPKKVRPGGFIYFQVVDPDRCVSAQKDKLNVRIRAESGDEETVELEETEPFSGMFRGRVRTNVKPPDCQASDSAEGFFPSLAISPPQEGRPGYWKAIPDGKEGKWFQADLKAILPVKQIRFTTGLEPGNGILEATLQSSIDGEVWDMIAAYPETHMIRPGSTIFRSMAATQEEWRSSPTLERTASRAEKVWSPQMKKRGWQAPFHINKFLPFMHRSNKYILSASIVPATGVYEFRVESGYPAVLFIDEKEVARTGEPPVKMALEEGLHTIALAMFRKGRNATTAVQIKNEKGQWVDLPGSWFDTKLHPELAGTETAPEIKREGSFTYKDENGNEATAPATWVIDLKEPVKTRFLRLDIRKYSGDAPTVAKLIVNNPLGTQILPSDVDVTKLKGNAILEMTPGDIIRAFYLDELNIRKRGEPYDHEVELSARYFNGTISTVHISFDPNSRRQRFYPLRRFQAGDRLYVSITEYDADLTPEQDKIPVVARSEGTGSEIRVEAIETEPRSGHFLVEIDTSLTKSDDVTLKVKEGDRIRIAYRDKENTDPGVPYDREVVIQEAQSTKARIRILESRMQENRRGNRSAHYQTSTPWSGAGGATTPKRVTLEAPLMVEVYDPSRALHAASSIPVWLESSSGDRVAVVLGTEHFGESLDKGIFHGNVYLQLGNPNDPRERVLAQDTNQGVFYFGDVSRAASTSRTSRRRGKKDDDSVPSFMGVEVATVLNVSGGDTITARYDPNQTMDEEEEEGGKGKAGTTFSAATISDRAQIITDGQIAIVDLEYEEEVESVQLGDRLYLKVEDGDADLSPTEDTIRVDITSSAGEAESTLLIETLPHSGVFTVSVPTVFVGEGAEKQKATPKNNQLEVHFGDELTVTYTDKANTVEEGPVDRTATAEVSVGADGDVMAFGKRFSNAKVAVKTQLNIAEAYFELAKQHRDLKREKLAEEEIRTGRQILREAVKDYPDTEYAVQALYLLANLDEEYKNYDDAIDQYREVLRRWPDSEYAPHANFKMALCYEKLGDFDRASEEYVSVAYKWPDHELVGSVIIRLGQYFYNRKEYLKAADVFIKLPERFPDHELAEKAFLQVSQCYGLAGEWIRAAQHCEDFLERFGAESELRPQALYWTGYCYMKAEKPDAMRAYKMFKNCVWDYPESNWAKYARRMLLNKMFERIDEES